MVTLGVKALTYGFGEGTIKYIAQDNDQILVSGEHLDLPNVSVLTQLPAGWASQVALVVKNSPANAGDMRHGFSPWIGKVPRRKAWEPTPVFLPGESHGQRSLIGYSPWGHTESDLTEAT